MKTCRSRDPGLGGDFEFGPVTSIDTSNGRSRCGLHPNIVQ